MAIKTLYIKNMLSKANIAAVHNELEKLGIDIISIEKGKAVLLNPVDNNVLFLIKNALLNNGFELVSYKKSHHIDKIKELIEDIVHHHKEIPLYKNFSDYLSEQVGFDYSYLSNLFSSLEGITIEKFIILQKIERIKELLIYKELTLTQIAYDLGYSSVQHLSNQFKKNTGFSPSNFKKLSRNAMDHSR